MTEQKMNVDGNDSSQTKNNWKASLIAFFERGIKPSAAPRLGVELEHFILDRESRAAVPYSGERGVRQILTRLMESYPEADILPDDDFFGFRVPEFNITLEPAAQFEISIAPMESVRRIGEVYRNFSNRLDAVLEEYGYAAFQHGCQPVSRVADLKIIPKRRYELMNAYFQKSGTGGMEMMRGTASLQVSIDYQSETDFRRKIQAAYYFGPLLKLFCDNTTSFQGKSLRTFLKRTDIWRRVDPSRCGILPGIFSRSYGFGDYADFLGAMPPIFLKSDGQILPTGAKTVAELYEGREMREEEITHILSMAFPDVRLKQFLEIRFADSVPLPFMLAYCTLVKGLLCSAEGLEFAEERISADNLSESSILQAEDALMEHGWNAVCYGRPVKELAETLLALARNNLPEDEAKYLNAFHNVAEYGGIRNIPMEMLRIYAEE